MKYEHETLVSMSYEMKAMKKYGMNIVFLLQEDRSAALHAPVLWMGDIWAGLPAATYGIPFRRPPAGSRRGRRTGALWAGTAASRRR